ncbi:hypothetical protein N658DRAFT_496744 [Parathielavia hyrcaniae]|uniref:Uncharacterized protein n=1 Tax=Parathielavia hyrcaniae TaxID=113614 RepID=A0AAN6T0X9_9PEZI|nr:hypothetical protein N658DRAFT_496744 [Parathielavia hyrcaniae]
MMIVNEGVVGWCGVFEGASSRSPSPGFQQPPSLGSIMSRTPPSSLPRREAGSGRGQRTGSHK